MIVCDVCHGPGKQMPGAGFDCCGDCAMAVLTALCEREPELMADVFKKQPRKTAPRISAENTEVLSPGDDLVANMAPRVPVVQDEPNMERQIKDKMDRRQAELSRKHGCAIYLVTLQGMIDLPSTHQYGSENMVEAVEKVQGKQNQYWARKVT